jgi:hypothetical protein
VFNPKELTPTAVFKQPVVLDKSAVLPTAVFDIPVELASK